MNHNQQAISAIQVVDPHIFGDVKMCDWHPDTVAACPEFDIHLPRIMVNDMINAVGIIPARGDRDATRISDAWCNSNVYHYRGHENGGLNQVFANILAMFSDHVSMNMRGKKGINDFLGHAKYIGNGSAGLSGKIWFMTSAIENVRPLLHSVAAEDVHMRLKLSPLTACWQGSCDVPSDYGDGYTVKSGFMDFNGPMINAVMLAAWCDLAGRLKIHQGFHNKFSLAEMVTNECDRLYGEHIENKRKAYLCAQQQRGEQQKREEQQRREAQRKWVEQQQKPSSHKASAQIDRLPLSCEWKHVCCDDDKITADMAWGRESEASIMSTDLYFATNQLF